MEEVASGDDEALLGRMRALARRGAELRRIGDGTGLIAQAEGRRPAHSVAPEDFLRMLDAGWIRASGLDRFVISRRGIAALRQMLSRPGESQKKVRTKVQGSSISATPVAPSVRPGLNIKESPLAWLASRRDKHGKAMITTEQLAAGERLRADFERGRMGPRLTSSWSPAASSSRQSRGAPGAGVEMSDSVVAARQRVEAALKVVGPELSGVLLDVCCFLKGIEQAERNGGWPRRAGKAVLQLGLAHLARHYGFEVADQSTELGTRLWHADGWNPRTGVRSTGSDEDDHG